MIVALFRLHIVAIAALAAVVFGWLFDGQLGIAAGALVGLDWCLLNLWNRIADVREDLQNQVEGTRFVARSGRDLSRLALGVLSLSLFAALRFGWPLLVLRLAFHTGGLIYSFPLLGRRVKEVFLAKNVFSGLLFILSVIGYPIAISRRLPAAGELLALMLFFLPLEITYQLIYDLRDVAGDAAAGIVTLPIAWGVRRTRAFIEMLLALSAAALLVGYLLDALRWRELVMIAAPMQQALELRFWIPREVEKRDAEGITWLGAAQLASYLAWIAAGLPLERPW